MKYLALLAALAHAAACGSSEEPPTDVNEYLPAPDPAEGFQVGMTVTAPAGTEIWKCLVLEELPFDERIAYISRGEHRQSAFVHHMDLMALGTTGVRLEPGMYDCDDVYQGADGDKIMDQGLILYASQQEQDEVVLPPGTVAEVPTATPFMYEVHYVNTSDQDVEVKSYINAYVIPFGDVRETIWGGPVRDRHINVPAGATEHLEWSRCEMDEEIQLLFLSSHTHELAYNFTVRTWDGDSAGDIIYSNENWENPSLEFFDPPLTIPAGQGFEFTCHYASDREETTTWGFTSRDEMCQIGIVYTPGASNADCVVVETSDGVIME